MMGNHHKHWRDLGTLLSIKGYDQGDPMGIRDQTGYTQFGRMESTNVKTFCVVHESFEKK